MEAQGTLSVRKPNAGLRLILLSAVLSLFLYLSGFFVWLTPLPLLLVFYRGKSLKGFAAIGAAAAILALLYFAAIPWVEARFGSKRVFEIFFFMPGMVPELAGKGMPPATWGMGYYLFFAALGALLGEFESRNYSPTRLVGQTAGLAALLVFLWIAVYTRGNFPGLVTGLETYFVDLIRSLLEVQQANEEVQVQIRFLRDHAEQIAAYTVGMLPGMVINVILFVTWLNIVVSRKVFYKELLFPALGPLRRWRLPFAAVWAVIAAAFLLIADRYLFQTGWLQFVAYNAFLVFLLVYFFQGLAIMVFFSVRWSLSPMIRFLLYAILILFFQPVGLLLVAFGFFDSWFDFRKLTPKPAS